MLQFMGSQRVGQYLATEEEEQQQSISGEADLSNDTAGLKGAAPQLCSPWDRRVSPGFRAGSLNSSSDAEGASLPLRCLGTEVYINLGLHYIL